MDDNLERLREAYQKALEQYEDVAATLNRHILAQTEPSSSEKSVERAARAQLELARRLYLGALIP